MSIAGGIVETARALGVDPVDLATAISYETGGTFDPSQAGPTTQWGQHRGLIQFGEPQARQYGVDWTDPAGSQLGADGAIARYLRATGVRPGMGLLDIYSAINAGGVGRYGASDANNGGAPGTVRDKVEQQMAAHRQNAIALLGGAAPATGPSGRETPQPTGNNALAALMGGMGSTEAVNSLAEQPEPRRNALAVDSEPFMTRRRAIAPTLNILDFMG